MDIGISLASSTHLDAEEGGRHLVHRARLAAEAELATLTLGDQHAVGAFGYLQNVPALGRLLADWPSERPAGCLFLLPMWPPVLVAEQVGTLAALHDGPFVVQTGIGGSPEQFAALGASPERRVTVFNEAVRIVDRLLAGDTVDSELFGFTDVSIGLVPGRPVDWWMGTMSGAGVDRAARFGAAWYASPGATVAGLEPLFERYQVGCAEHGTTPRVMLRRDVMVLRDGDRARELAAGALRRGYRNLTDEHLIVGDPDEAAAQLRPFAELGVDQIVVRTMGVEPEVDLETIECLADVRSSVADI